MENQTMAPSPSAIKVDRKQLHIEALAESQQDIDEARADLFEKIRSHQAIGGEDKYDGGILEILKRSITDDNIDDGSDDGTDESNDDIPDGVTTAELHTVFTDSAELAASRRRLVRKRHIAEDKEGMTYRLTLAKTAAEEVTVAAAE